MMNRAEEWGWHERDSNPCLGIVKIARNKVARFFDGYSNRWPDMVAAIRPLALTGCRRSEVLDLRWRNIGGDALNFVDWKTRAACCWTWQ